MNIVSNSIKKLREELGEHVLDFVLAAHVLTFYEAGFCDSEVATAARADCREVEVLGDVVGEDRMAVDHLTVLVLSLYNKYKKIRAFRKP